MNAMHCPYPVGWSLLDEGEGQTGITTFSGLLIWFVLREAVIYVLADFVR